MDFKTFHCIRLYIDYSICLKTSDHPAEAIWKGQAQQVFLWSLCLAATKIWIHFKVLECFTQEPAGFRRATQSFVHERHGSQLISCVVLLGMGEDKPLRRVTCRAGTSSVLRPLSFKPSFHPIRIINSFDCCSSLALLPHLKTVNCR